MDDYAVRALAVAAGSDAMTRSIQHLQALADLLGVPTEAFSTPSAPRLLYEAANGDRWLLVSDHDTPLVHHIKGDPSGPAVDLDLSAFLQRHVGSPQHKALLGLIQEALVAHLA